MLIYVIIKNNSIITAIFKQISPQQEHTYRKAFINIIFCIGGLNYLKLIKYSDFSFLVKFYLDHEKLCSILLDIEIKN